MSVILHYVYKITCYDNGKVFYGIQPSTDPFWCNPACLLSQVTEDKLNFRMHWPAPVREDIKKYGKHRFIIETVYGSAIRESAEAHLGKIVTPEFRLLESSYNRPIGRKPKTSTR